MIDRRHRHREGHVWLQHCYAEVDAPIVDFDILVPTGQQGVSYGLTHWVARSRRDVPLLIDFRNGVLSVELPDNVGGAGVAFSIEVDDGSGWDDVREGLANVSAVISGHGSCDEGLNPQGGGGLKSLCCGRKGHASMSDSDMRPWQMLADFATSQTHCW